ncbi:hypothetical protein TruAng_012231 [Truncatella angustata]|nr:hypothetical protein TruAng_012231 [Truncatella angustata]
MGTVRIRKVKCDERRPQCLRCSSTGRKCDGYVPPPLGTYSWSHLIQPSLDAIQTTTSAESHILSYFRQVVAPSLAGPLDTYLWANIVVQVSSREAAAKHAVLAISSLYQSFHKDWAGFPHVTQEEAFVMRHYNEAIIQLRAASDQHTILVVCMLFVCIEFMRGDHKRAIDHCRHGIHMLNRAPTETEFVREYMRPLFCRLSVFPYFFGASPDTFPSLEYPSMDAKTSFSSLADAHMALNPLIARTVRFVRSADTYRLGLLPLPTQNFGIMKDRQVIDSSLDSWFVAFHFYKTHKASTLRDDKFMRMLEIRWLTCKIWLDTCFSKEESIYDTHLDKFRTIVDLANDATVLIDAANKHRQPRVAFEIGFGPFLAFVVIKCRCLKLRITALTLMKEISPPREHCWDTSVLFALGQRTIEIEHDLKLDLHMQLDKIQHDVSLPPEEKRIRDSIMHLESGPLSGVEGIDMERQMICFLMKDPSGDGIVNRDEPLTAS